MPVEHSRNLLRWFRSAAAAVGEDSKPSFGEVVLEVRGFVGRRNAARLDVVEELRVVSEVERLVAAILDCDTKREKNSSSGIKIADVSYF